MPLEWQEVARIGRKMVAFGLTSSRFGNISLRKADKIFITCTGSMLDELDQSQVTEVDLNGPCPTIASIETCVHQAIYKSTSALAIIHTHSPYAVALSMIEKEVIEPIDSEGIFFLGSVPIVDGRFGTEELARKVSYALKTINVCIVRGHGVFAAGKNLTEAYTAACMTEHSSKVRYLVKAYHKSFPL